MQISHIRLPSCGGNGGHISRNHRSFPLVMNCRIYFDGKQKRLAPRSTRPDMHVMLMSGGLNGNLLVLNYGWAFIQKPFVSAKLVQMITEVLHSADRSQPGGQEFDSRRDTL